MPAFVFDLESDGLIDEVTKIHCVAYSLVSELDVKVISSYEDMIAFFTQPDLTLLGHKIVEYDIRVIKKILGIEVKAKLVDTLAVSYYIHSSDGRQKHGLESYTEQVGVAKPKITDWENQTQADYEFRVSSDVQINWLLWKNEQQPYLMELYNRDLSEIFRLLEYLTFKYELLREQDENRIPLNIDLLVDEMLKLEELVSEKREALLTVMPEVVKYKTVTKPKKLEKADGSLSVQGQKWLNILEKEGLNKDSDISEIEIIDYKEEPNPDSTQQLKEWLFSLNWSPIHFKFVRNKVTNEIKQIPQLTSEIDKTQICESILQLSEEVPELKHLAGYSTVKHRLGILKGFLESTDDSLKVSAGAMGTTNTMRFRHMKPITNLPKPTAPYAENIRACLIAPENHYLVGCDIMSAEDSTKQHYIYPLDPDYVDSMRSEGYDPHLDIAVRAGLLTEAQVEEHKAGTASYKEERNLAKTCNFAATYGVKKGTLARNMKKTEKEAQVILDAYWERNKSLKQFEKTCETKTVRGQLWVKQPVSGFFYTLRNSKDIFSTVNQSTAVYVFDRWVYYMRRHGIKLSLNIHDEAGIIMHNSVDKSQVEFWIRDAMRETNEELQLNITMGCSVDFGNSYKDIH